MPRLKPWLLAIALAALFLLSVAMCARAQEGGQECMRPETLAAALAVEKPPFSPLDELSGAELAAFLELTGGQGLPAAQIVAWVQLHTDVTLILLFDADGCLIAFAEDTRYGFDQKARLARERAAS